MIKFQDITIPTTRVEGSRINYKVFDEAFKVFVVQTKDSSKGISYKSMATQTQLKDLITLFAYNDSNSNKRLLLIFDKHDAITADELFEVFKKNGDKDFTVRLLDSDILFNYLNSMTLTNQYNLLLNIMPNYMKNNNFSLDTLRTYGITFSSRFYLQRVLKKGELVDKYDAYHFYNFYFVAGESRQEDNVTFLKLRETAFYPVKVKDIKGKFIEREKLQIVDSRLELVDTNNLNAEDIVYINSPQVKGRKRGEKPDDLAKAAYLSDKLDSRVNIEYQVLDMLNVNMSKFIEKPLTFSDLSMTHISDFKLASPSELKLPNFKFLIDLGGIKSFLVDDFDISILKEQLTDMLNETNKKIKDKKAALWREFDFEFISRSKGEHYDKPILMLVPNVRDVDKQENDPYFWDAGKNNVVQHLDIWHVLYSKRGSHKYDLYEKTNSINSKLKTTLPATLLELYYKSLRKQHLLPAYIDSNFKNIGYIYLKPQYGIKKNATFDDVFPFEDNFWIVGGFTDADMKWHELTYRDILEKGDLLYRLIQHFLEHRQSRWIVYNVEDTEKFAFIDDTQMRPLYQRQFYDRQKLLNFEPFSTQEVLALLEGINDSENQAFVPDFETFKQGALTYLDDCGGSLNAEQLKQLLLSKIDIDSELILKSSKKSLSRLKPEFNEIAQEKIGRDIYMSKKNKNGQFLNEMGGLLDVNYILNVTDNQLLYCAGALNPNGQIDNQPVIYLVNGDADIVKKYLGILKSLLSQLIRFNQTSVINIAQKYVLQACYDEEYNAGTSEKSKN